MQNTAKRFQMKVEELIGSEIDTIITKDEIIIESDDKTPYVEIIRSEGLLKFEGRSIPENAQQFYKPILLWLAKYMENPVALTTLFLNLEYFNTSSSKIILDIMMRLRRMQEAGHQVKVVWMYHEEDEEMHEAGDDYASLIEIPFEISSFK